MSNSEILSTHPYDPYIPEGATKLIIGTIPPYRFCITPQELFSGDVNFYYGSRDNYFWKLISEVTNKKLDFENTEKAIKQRKELLDKLNIGITDIVQHCIHENRKSDDKSLKFIENKPLDNLLLQYTNINTLLYTSNFVISQINKIADKKYHENWVDGTQGKEGTVIFNGNEYTVIVLYSPSPYALLGLGKDGSEKRLAQYYKVFGGY
jgi:G:T/U-mismatch repair DNA glycosylase